MAVRHLPRLRRAGAQNALRGAHRLHTEDGVPHIVRLPIRQDNTSLIADVNAFIAQIACVGDVTGCPNRPTSRPNCRLAGRRLVRGLCVRGASRYDQVRGTRPLDGGVGEGGGQGRRGADAP